MTVIYIVVYIVIAITTIVARLDYLWDYQDLEEGELWSLSIIYGVFWPIGFLSTIIYRFFILMRP